MSYLFYPKVLYIFQELKLYANVMQITFVHFNNPPLLHNSLQSNCHDPTFMNLVLCKAYIGINDSFFSLRNQHMHCIVIVINGSTFSSIFILMLKYYHSTFCFHLASGWKVQKISKMINWWERWVAVKTSEAMLTRLYQNWEGVPFDQQWNSMLDGAWHFPSKALPAVECSEYICIFMHATAPHINRI